MAFCKIFCKYLVIFGSILTLSSCSVFRKNNLFQTDTSINVDKFDPLYDEINKAYKIATLDFIAVSVFTNDGEVLVDPNREFEMGNAGGNNGLNNNNNNNNNNRQGINNITISRNGDIPRQYRIEADGSAKLPLVGKVMLAELTLKQAEEYLSKKYETYYEAPFVVVRYTNKRVVVMGALGNRVIPLTNENMTLVEVLAMTGDLQNKGKPNNIRIIRDYQSGNPSVQIVDLSTIEGMVMSNLIIHPNDVIYIEPRFGVDTEVLSIMNTFVLAFTSVISVLLLIDNISKK